MVYSVSDAAGGAAGGGSASPKVFICWKSKKKSLKLWEKSLKICAKYMKMLAKVAPNFVWLQNWCPNLRKNRWKPFFGRRTKKGLHDFCGRMFVGKSRATPFWASLGKFGQNPSHSQNVLAPTPMFTTENWISEVWNGRSHVRMEKIIHTCSFSCLLNRLFSDFLPDKQQAIAKTCQMRRCENITRSAHLRSWSKDRSKQRSLL